MARPIVLSNGTLHVGINKYGNVHDFYYPHVGQENHSAGQGTRHRIGVWADGEISWLDEPVWQRSFQTADYSLVGHVRAHNERLGLLLEFEAFVASSADAFIRSVHVINLRDEAREVRLFMHQAFVIGESRGNHDTAQYLPDSDAILHYHGPRAFVVSARLSGGPYFDQHSIGLFGIEGHEGTYRDADDGELSNNAVEHGRVDSVLRLSCRLAPHDSCRLQYWIACGTSPRAALNVHKIIRDNGIDPLLHETVHWWHKWLRPAFKASQPLPPARKRQFIKSAMLIKSHIDAGGAVIASTDTTMLNYSRDAYAYCWPRDASYALWPLIRMGYTDEALRFFDFCREVLHPAGYLMHKYQADGSLGPSWHPYDHGDTQGPPIQEDETALVLFMIVQTYQLTGRSDLLDKYYRPLVKPMADFLASYIDESTGLPRPSYDLWEEKYLTSTYTTAVVYGALSAAADMAEAAHDEISAVKWRAAADDIRQSARKRLFNPKRGMFYKGVTAHPDGLERDGTIDVSSFFGAFMYGLFPTGSSEIMDSLQTLRQTFGVSLSRPVLPRYENDNYQRTDNSTLGNLWYVTSLWLAQYAVETGDTGYYEAVLDWIERRLDATGIMAEQLSPDGSQAVSVSPLIWSHAEYLTTILDRQESAA
jgi:GH15 family glucan-1,4-alpha-glucosidase